MLRAIGGVTAAAVLPTLLGACSGGRESKPNASTSNAKVQLPTFVPYEGVKPDLAPTTDGVLAGFLSYPAEPVAGLTEKLPAEHGAGPEVDLKPRFIPLAEYPSKPATVQPADERSNKWAVVSPNGVHLRLQLLGVPTSDWQK